MERPHLPPRRKPMALEYFPNTSYEDPEDGEAYTRNMLPADRQDFLLEFVKWTSYFVGASITAYGIWWFFSPEPQLYDPFEASSKNSQDSTEIGDSNSTTPVKLMKSSKEAVGSHQVSKGSKSSASGKKIPMDFSNLKKLFEKYDLNKDGLIDQKEMKLLINDYVKRSSHKPSSEDVNYIVSHFSKDAFSHGITFHEFKRLLSMNSPFFKWKMLQDFYDKYDEDKNGLDTQEFEDFMMDMSQALNLPKPGLPEVKKFFDKVDKDHNGRISFQEFLGWIEMLETAFKSSFNPRILFLSFDFDKDGFLNLEEWGYFLDAWRHYHQQQKLKVLTDKEKKDLFVKLDKHKKNKLSFSDVVNWLPTSLQLLSTSQPQKKSSTSKK